MEFYLLYLLSIGNRKFFVNFHLLRYQTPKKYRKYFWKNAFHRNNEMVKYLRFLPFLLLRHFACNLWSLIEIWDNRSKFWWRYESHIVTNVIYIVSATYFNWFFQASWPEQESSRYIVSSTTSHTRWLQTVSAPAETIQVELFATGSSRIIFIMAI